MPESRTQRYRVTVEILLQDRGSYEHIRRQLQAAFDSLQEHNIGIMCDYLSIEKVSDR